MREKIWSVFFILALALLLRPANAMAFGPPLRRAADRSALGEPLENYAAVSIYILTSDGSEKEAIDEVAVLDKLKAVVDGVEGPFTYQWYRCAEDDLDEEFNFRYAPIPGASGEAYQVAPEDAGMLLQVRVKHESYEGEAQRFAPLQVKKYLGNATVILEPDTFVYNGRVQNPVQNKTVVKIGEEVLSMGSDYTPPPFGDSTVNAGRYRAVVTPGITGVYSGQAYGYYTIKPAKPELKLEPEEISLVAGASQALAPVLTGVEGENVLDSGYMEYQSSDPSVVSVEGGVLTAKKAGEATVTAVYRCGEKSNYTDSDSAECTVRVEARAVTAIAVAESPETVYEYGQPFDPAGLVLTVTYNSGQTGTVRYPDEGIAWSPAELGGVGDKTVTITYGGGSTELPVTVTPAAPEGKDAVYGIKYDDLSAQTVPAAAFGVSLSGSFTLGEIGAEDRALLETLEASGDTVSFSLKEGLPAEALTVSIPVVFHPDSENYRDRELTLTVQVSVRQVPVLTAGSFRRTYSGAAVTVDELLGSLRASCGAGEVPGTWSAASALPSDARAEAYSCLLSFTPDDAGEYEAGTVEISITIDPAEVTVTAGDKEAVQGGAMPELTYTVTGLLGSDTLTEEPLLSCEAGDTSRAGTFQITAAGADAGGNYTIVYRPGTLTVKAPAPSGTVQTPAASPASGTSFAGSLLVTLTCGTEGADIFYTLDGASPIASGTRYTGPIRLTGTATVRAAAVKEGMYDSAVMTAVYTRIEAEPPQIAAPVIEPTGGSFSGSCRVTITATAGAEIYYTLDGTEPSASSTRYTGPFTLRASAVVKAIAVVPGMAESDAVSAVFTFRDAPPVSPDPDPAPEEPIVPDKPSAPDGGQGGGSPATPSVPSGDAVRPEAAVSGGTARVDFTGSAAEKLVEQALSGKGGALVITPVISGDVSRTEVTLPAAAAGEIAAWTGAELKVETPAAEITIPSGSLARLGGPEGEIAIAAGTSGDGVEVAVTVDGRPVEHLPMEAAIPFPCGPGTVAQIVDGEGNVLSVVRKSCASGDGQTMTVPLDGPARVVFREAGRTFADVPAGSWAAGAAAFVSSRRLMGEDGGGFRPGEAVTRAMLSTVLYNLEGSPETVYVGGFQDVPEGAWYAEAVQWAAEQGAVTGVFGGSFEPGAPVTREQLALTLYCYAGRPAVPEEALEGFRDAGDVSSWTARAVAWAVSEGIIGGDNGSLRPRDSATRAEMAQMLMHLVSGGAL